MMRENVISPPASYSQIRPDVVAAKLFLLFQKCGSRKSNMLICFYAGMAELVDAPDLGSGGIPCPSSSLGACMSNLRVAAQKIVPLKQNVT